MRASRLLSILLLLQARGRMTARALAMEFQVSVRTIYRDVDDLSASGVPIYAERGPEGGFELVEGYRTRLTGLTAPEAESLFLLGLPGPAADLGLGQALMTAQLKLNAALPDARRRGAERVASRFHLDPTGWYCKSDSAGFLPALSDAVWNARRIRARYASTKRLELLASAVSEKSTRTKGDVDEKGWAHITIPIESIDHAAGELLRLGTEAEVLGPPALRRRMAEIAAQLSAIYRPDDRVRAEPAEIASDRI